jgi:hypothetical protein
MQHFSKKVSREVIKAKGSGSLSNKIIDHMRGRANTKMSTDKIMTLTRR